jgi:drug/metabolite transporter (DMT)-like permease
MTRSKIDWRRLWASAGFIVAVLLWVVNMELGQILPESQCQGQNHPLGLTSLAALVLSLASAYVSWRSPWPTRAGLFWSRICALMPLLFGFALLLQLSAGFMLSGCEK